MVEGEKVLEVNESPLEIIKNSLEYYGNSFEGAIKRAKNALGNVSMPPVQISCKLGIYWFSSKSPIHEDCVWFGVDHIYGYNQLPRKMLKVYFRNGFEVTLDGSYSVFGSKVNRTNKFKDIMQRSNKNRSYYGMTREEYKIARESISGTL